MEEEELELEELLLIPAAALAARPLLPPPAWRAESSSRWSRAWHCPSSRLTPW